MYLLSISILIPTGLNTGMVEGQTKNRMVFQLLKAMTGVPARLQLATMPCVTPCIPRQKEIFCTHCATGDIRMLSSGVIRLVRAGECGGISSHSGMASLSGVGGSVYQPIDTYFPRKSLNANCNLVPIVNHGIFFLEYSDFWGHNDLDMLEVGNGVLTEVIIP